MFDAVGELLDVRPLKSDYYVLTFRVPEVAAAAQPGQFVHVRIPTLHEARLRRPFSIYGADAAQGLLYILYKVVGKGTQRLSELSTGDNFPILGPLGKGFPLTPKGTPFLVAGGYGVAPLYFLATRLPVKGSLFVGGRTAADVLEVERFKDLGWKVHVATQDGSLGTKGFVTLPLDEALAAEPNAELYCCGPDGLLKAVGERAIARGLQGWLSLDKHMVCAVGACLACVQTLRRADGTQWVGRVCQDGPVFESREIVW